MALNFISILITYTLNRTFFIKVPTKLKMVLIFYTKKSNLPYFRCCPILCQNLILMCFAALTRMNQFKKLHFAEVASALNVNVEAREAAAAMFGSKADRIVVFYTATAILGFQLGARQQQQQPYTALTHTMRLRRCQVSIQFVKLCQAAATTVAVRAQYRISRYCISFILCQNI